VKKDGNEKKKNLTWQALITAARRRQALNKCDARARSW
jgi:hypothetical protein